MDRLLAKTIVVSNTGWVLTWGPYKYILGSRGGVKFCRMVPADDAQHRELGSPDEIAAAGMIGVMDDKIDAEHAGQWILMSADAKSLKIDGNLEADAQTLATYLGNDPITILTPSKKKEV